MLMRCRVEDDIRPVCLDHTVYTSRVSYGTDQSDQIKTGILSFQLLLNSICIIFINIKDNQFFRSGTRDLTAQLASDGAASSGYHNDLPF